MKIAEELMKEEKEQWMISMSSGIKEGVISIKEKINSVVFLSSSLKRCYTETTGIQSVCVYLGEVRYYIPVLRC